MKLTQIKAPEEGQKSQETKYCNNNNNRNEDISLNVN